MTTLYFVRHGEAENSESLIYGRMPGFHLSKNGEEKATQLAKYFSKKPIEAIYTSPLERCYETANTIARALPIRIPVDHIFELIEVDAKGWQGLSWDEAFKNEVYERFLSDPDASLPGENLTKMATRMVKLTHELIRKHAEEEVVCVSHEFPILVLKLKLQNKPLVSLRNLDLPTGGIIRFVFDKHSNLSEADEIELQ